MAGRDDTQIGGLDAKFRTTQWTRILDARTADHQRRRDATGAIVQQYWKPVYSFLRRRGLNNEQAKDLTQGFFCDILLSRQLVQQADRAKGRFRALLLSALERYLVGQHRLAGAQKRNPPGSLVSLDGFAFDPAGSTVAEPADDCTPHGAFAYAWAAALVEDVVAAVAESCQQDGLAKHWEVFDATVVRPALAGTSPPRLADVCGALGIESEAKASNMSITVKRRFQAALRARVGQYADSVDEEIRDLMRILSTRGG